MAAALFIPTVIAIAALIVIVAIGLGRSARRGDEQMRPEYPHESNGIVYVSPQNPPNKED